MRKKKEFEEIFTEEEIEEKEKIKEEEIINKDHPDFLYGYRKASGLRGNKYLIQVGTGYYWLPAELDNKDVLITKRILDTLELRFGRKI